MAHMENVPRFGQLGILNVTPAPSPEGFPPRVELGEQFPLSAQVFGAGREPVRAEVTLTNPAGKHTTYAMPVKEEGLDLFELQAQAGKPSTLMPWQAGYKTRIAPQLGRWTFVITGWEDRFSLWLHDIAIRVSVHDDDLENAFAEGAQLLTEWADKRSAHVPAASKKLLRDSADKLVDTSLSPEERLAIAQSNELKQLNEVHPLRTNQTKSTTFHLEVERPHASFTSWYQFFPRSEGAHYAQDGSIVPGNLKSAEEGLERAKEEGFNTVYIPPIFPIGHTHRKGKDGSLTAGPTDPGSPWAIGSEEGGHDTVDPALGTMKDFAAFCKRAHELDLEVALDFALQCSPDHPWVKQHPNWFKHKADGSIAFAENPPMKYEDIYPLNFDEDMDGIIEETVRCMKVWIKAGVTAFRVDNPHTKPTAFWQQVIAEVHEDHPEVLFLAESFTRPAPRRALAYAGFTQSHCYFLWRNTGEELEEFLPQVNGTDGFYTHDTLWPSTPDNLTAFLRDGGIAAHAIRAVLAALGSPTWGIYSGYELVENKQLEGTEEPADNEKFEIKVRDWNATDQYGIKLLLTVLNKIRSEHPATHSFHNLTVHKSDNPNVIAFSRYTPAEVSPTGKADRLVCVVNLDPHNTQAANIELDLGALGLDANAGFDVEDLLTGAVFHWGSHNWVCLSPNQEVAHILSVRA